jgi:hypothetical protein
MRKTTLNSTSPLSDIPLIQGRDEVDDSRLQLLIQLEFPPPSHRFRGYRSTSTVDSTIRAMLVPPSRRDSGTELGGTR